MIRIIVIRLRHTTFRPSAKRLSPGLTSPSIHPTFRKFQHRSIYLSNSLSFLSSGPLFTCFVEIDTLTEAFTLVSGPVDENLGRYDVAKRDEHLHELYITEILRQVVDEQVAAFGS